METHDNVPKNSVKYYYTDLVEYCTTDPVEYYTQERVLARFEQFKTDTTSLVVLYNNKQNHWKFSKLTKMVLRVLLPNYKWLLVAEKVHYDDIPVSFRKHPIVVGLWLHMADNDDAFCKGYNDIEYTLVHTMYEEYINIKTIKCDDPLGIAEVVCVDMEKYYRINMEKMTQQLASACAEIATMRDTITRLEHGHGPAEISAALE